MSNAYVIIAEETGSPAYTVGIFTSMGLARKAVRLWFGEAAEKLDKPLLGSGLSTKEQYRVFRTIVSICIHQIDLV